VGGRDRKYAAHLPQRLRQLHHHGKWGGIGTKFGPKMAVKQGIIFNILAIF
jgi:hypothetical protein